MMCHPLAPLKASQTTPGTLLVCNKEEVNGLHIRPSLGRAKRPPLPLYIVGTHPNAFSWNLPSILPRGNHPRFPPFFEDEHSEYFIAISPNFGPGILLPSSRYPSRISLHASLILDCFSQRICLAFTKLQALSLSSAPFPFGGIECNFGSRHALQSPASSNGLRKWVPC